jgi:hypothetical protein
MLPAFSPQPPWALPALRMPDHKEALRSLIFSKDQSHIKKLAALRQF